MFTRQDVRKAGSGNIGATNVYRAAGAIPAVLTLTADVLKGAVPVYLSGWFEPSVGFQKDLFMCSVAFSSFIGHLYPVFLRFKTGGKGVATAAGCFFILCPGAVFAGLLVFAVFLFFSGRVSIGSLAAGAVMPIAARSFSCSDVVIGFSVLVAVFIFFRHTDNIKRLREGKEPAFRFRRDRK
jgi:glycerol-3-phosphate acyltransferase PlsY